MSMMSKTNQFIKSSAYLIIFPIIRVFLNLFFQLKNTKLGGIFYDSLSSIKGLKYFCVDTGKELFVIDLKDKEIGKGLFCRGLFDFDKLLIAIEILEKHNIKFKPDLLVDVGANIGTISIPALTRKKFKSVIAFEPSPDNFILLKNNLILNDIEDRFEAHNCAVGEEDGKLELELSTDNSGDHRISVSKQNGSFNESNRKKILVNSYTLDSKINKFNSNSTLIWIDVQGYEGHVLSGSKRLIHKKVPTVIEFWPYGLQRTNGFSKLKEALSSYNGFYDLSSSENFYDIGELDFYFDKIGVDGNFVDLLVV
jgi:FkbM family methyltransferase